MNGGLNFLWTGSLIRSYWWTKIDFRSFTTQSLPQTKDHYSPKSKVKRSLGNCSFTCFPLLSLREVMMEILILDKSWVKEADTHHKVHSLRAVTFLRWDNGHSTMLEVTTMEIWTVPKMMESVTLTARMEIVSGMFLLCMPSSFWFTIRCFPHVIDILAQTKGNTTYLWSYQHRTRQKSHGMKHLLPTRLGSALMQLLWQFMSL